MQKSIKTTMMGICMFLLLSSKMFAQLQPSTGTIVSGGYAYSHNNGIQNTLKQYVQDEIIIQTALPLMWNQRNQSIEGLILPMGAKVIGCADIPMWPQDKSYLREGYLSGTQFLIKLPTPTAEDVYNSRIILQNNSFVVKSFLNAISESCASSPISQNDPHYASSQSHMRYDPSLIALGVKYTGWAHATGYKFKNTSKVLVAVLDAGLNFNHQDVTNSYWTNTSEMVNSIDDDANGFMNDYFGWDFVNSDNDPTDDNTGTWHGTHVFGILAARNNNNNNICGVITDTMSVMVLKVLNSSGNGTDFQAASAYNYALSKGARIISMSFIFSSTPSLLMSAIVTGVSNYKAVPVAGVGNTGTSYYGYPASGANVLTVGNANSGGSKYSTSSWSDSLDIMANGVSVVSLSGGSNTASLTNTGSSMSTPFVAGFCWWILKIDTSLTVQQVINIVRSYGTNGSFQSQTGYGYLVGIDTMCYRAMMPDTSITLTKCGNKQALPVSKVFSIVDSSRYLSMHIQNDSVNTNTCPVGTYDYKMAWKSEPRTSTYYLDTFQMQNRYMHFTVTGTGWTAAASAVTNSGTASVCIGDSRIVSKAGNTTAAKRKWYVNSTFIDTTASISYTASGTPGVDTIKLVVDLTSAGCWDKATDTVRVLITKVANLTPSVSIVASNNNVCAGTSITFTATPTNTGSSTPNYQWKLNGGNVGTNSSTYTNNTLANGDLVTCVVTPVNGCFSPATATSNTVTMIINSYVTPSVSISSSATSICAGTTVNFTATATNAGSPNYQWKLNGGNVGSNINTYSNSSLVNGDIVTCVVTPAGGCFTASTATSNAITMTVTTPVTPAISISASPSGTICAGTSVTFTAIPTNGGSSPSYQWKVNGGNVGSNTSTYTSSTLANGDLVTCVLTTSLTCTTAATATSNVITMTVTTPVTPSVTIASSATGAICPGTSVTFTATPTNGGGSPSYQWKKNGGNVGTNSPTYIDATLAGGDLITCVLTTSLTCTTTSTATSNTITMSVNPTLIPTIAVTTNPGNTICSGTNVTFTATPTNGGSSPSYQWKVNGGNVGTNSPTFSTSSLTNGQVITCILTSNATCASPGSVTSTAITMTVNAKAVPPTLSITNTPPVLNAQNKYQVLYTANVAATATEPIKFYLNVKGTPTLQATITAGKDWLHVPMTADADTVFAVRQVQGCYTVDSAKSNTVRVGSPVGITVLPEQSELKLYPNPTTGLFKIGGLPDGCMVSLRAIDGRLLESRSEPSKSGIDMQFDLSSQPAAIYMIQVYFENQVKVYRLSKN